MVIDVANMDGLIPTYAGNTENLDESRAYPRAHPHVCGEHSGR